ncbi:glycerophosphoryl diester phosphodiesterase [Mesonia phycicola]|uniref:Glycerophosphoryl diester phosphodiesterase n=1 Tax=Mesonia phycicola TaxID=579105 RepID=A0A1M6G3R8_9FLAO|nr:glycerophosphodiester phosphodiesterase family protein [Mesonia phycicola]SHJ04625.1 glycerophosphoryl diester phosphodiesterase [Mesonia phycicola]
MKIQVQGHRGDRGNFPENSIPAFLSALKKGVDVLEMDVVISQDNKVVVSHEPFMSSLYMLQPNGKEITKEEELSFNLYKMPYHLIKQFDSGSKGNPNFLQQKKIKTYKPLLSEVLDTVEDFLKEEKIDSIQYNIEIKSEAIEYHKSQPAPEEFVTLVTEVIEQKKLTNRVILQSFDPAILEILHKKYPAIQLSYLVEEKSLEENLNLLSFTPNIFSPFYKMILNEEYVNQVKKLNMKLIPWTVNQPEAIKEMIKFQVDGIITDYPERVIEQLSTNK